MALQPNTQYTPLNPRHFFFLVDLEHNSSTYRYSSAGRPASFGHVIVRQYVRLAHTIRAAASSST
jgi:hypothetical protein